MRTKENIRSKVPHTPCHAPYPHTPFSTHPFPHTLFHAPLSTPFHVFILIIHTLTPPTTSLSTTTTYNNLLYHLSRHLAALQPPLIVSLISPLPLFLSPNPLSLSHPFFSPHLLSPLYLTQVVIAWTILMTKSLRWFCAGRKGRYATCAI